MKLENIGIEHSCILSRKIALFSYPPIIRCTMRKTWILDSNSFSCTCSISWHYTYFAFQSQTAYWIIASKPTLTSPVCCLVSFTYFCSFSEYAIIMLNCFNYIWRTTVVTKFTREHNILPPIYCIRFPPFPMVNIDMSKLHSIRFIDV